MRDEPLALARMWAGVPPTAVMEVCGTHTHAIARSGMRALLPPHVRLVSGPGCPVCVTDDADIRAALAIAEQPGASLFTFGDMLRVPVQGARGEMDSLARARGLGRDVRVAASPLDALEYAKAHPAREVVWFGVGFETTAPHTAALALRARAQGVKNLSVLCAHKTMPAALRALLGRGAGVDALLCPGHVAVIAGAEAFAFVPRELGMPAAIAGFQAQEIAAALAQLARMRARGEAALVNAYPAAVTEAGNRTAQDLTRAAFEPCAARWRGLGEIADSGLTLRAAFAAWDAHLRFDLSRAASAEAPAGCQCARVLRGELDPRDCPLFGRTCTPEAPRGPCMVSCEGACSAAYLYGGE